MREFVEATPANVWFTVAMVMVFATIFILDFTRVLKHGALVAEVTTLVVGILCWTLIQYEVITLGSFGAVLLIIVGYFGTWREIARKKAANLQD